jgi:hypothetical protein
MHVFKVALTGRKIEFFFGKILPAKGFVWDFCWKRFDARLKYFENLHNLMNLVVKWDLRGGGCRKKIFYIFQQFFHLRKKFSCFICSTQSTNNE